MAIKKYGTGTPDSIEVDEDARDEHLFDEDDEESVNDADAGEAEGENRSL